MNKVMLVGNIVRDANVSVVGDKGTCKAMFTIACNERLGKDNEMVNYIPCVIWGAMAEGLADYLIKGTKVAVSGRLDIKSVESDEYEGEYKTYVSVNVNELDFCSGSKKEDSGEKPKNDRKEKPKKKR